MKQILKKHKLYDCMSESKMLIKSKNWFIDIQEYYGDCHILEFRLWIKDKDSNLIFVNRRWIKLPLNWYAFYILYIYKHLGKCSPNIRSKFYIGKPREMKGE